MPTTNRPNDISKSYLPVRLLTVVIVVACMHPSQSVAQLITNMAGSAVGAIDEDHVEIIHDKDEQILTHKMKLVKRANPFAGTAGYRYSGNARLWIDYSDAPATYSIEVRADSALIQGEVRAIKIGQAEIPVRKSGALRSGRSRLFEWRGQVDRQTVESFIFSADPPASFDPDQLEDDDVRSFAERNSIPTAQEAGDAIFALVRADGSQVRFDNTRLIRAAALDLLDYYGIAFRDGEYLGGSISPEAIPSYAGAYGTYFERTGRYVPRFTVAHHEGRLAIEGGYGMNQGADWLEPEPDAIHTFSAGDYRVIFHEAEPDAETNQDHVRERHMDRVMIYGYEQAGGGVPRRTSWEYRLLDETDKALSIDAMRILAPGSVDSTTVETGADPQDLTENPAYQAARLRAQQFSDSNLRSRIEQMERTIATPNREYPRIEINLQAFKDELLSREEN